DIFERGSSDRALLRQRLASLGLAIERDDLMPAPHQPARDIRAHPAKPDHCDTHRHQFLVTEVRATNLKFVLFRRPSGGWGPCRFEHSMSFQISRDMDPCLRR